MLVLSLTGRCNFACKYCYAHEHAQETMSLDTAIKAINLVAGNPFVLQFSGGEPFLAFDLMQDIIEYVRKNNIPALMQVQTNASLLNAERAAYLRDAKVGIGISLDGRPDVNDTLRCLPSGKGSTQQIIKGVQQLATQGVEIGITCVVSADNVEQLTGVVEMAYYLGIVRKLGFDLLRAQGRGSSLQPAQAEALGKGVLDALKTAERLGEYTGKPMLMSQIERVRTLAQGKMQGFGHCHAMNGEAAFVDAQGNIYACSSLVGDENFWLGHVEEGINAERQQNVIACIQKSMAFCRQCSSFALCGGGCFARWYGSGCTDRAYATECALKKVCINWYEKTKK